MGIRSREILTEDELTIPNHTVKATTRQGQEETDEEEEPGCSHPESCVGAWNPVVEDGNRESRNQYVDLQKNQLELVEINTMQAHTKKLNSIGHTEQQIRRSCKERVTKLKDKTKEIKQGPTQRDKAFV